MNYTIDARTEALRSALTGALDALEFSRAQLKEYELAATREDYNSPTINVAIDEARAALSGSPPPSTERLREWHPIETAPKDGTTRILACAWYWWTPVNGDDRWERTPVVETWWSGDRFPVGESRDPTHWMPLPPAPDAARTALAGQAVE